MEEFLHIYEMESLSMGITARKDVVEQVKRFYLGDEAATNGMFRTALAMAARRDAKETGGEQASEGKEDGDDEDDGGGAAKPKSLKLVVAGNSKECFRNRLRNIQLVALSNAIVKSRFSVIHAVDVSHNYLGEEPDTAADAKLPSSSSSSGSITTSAKPSSKDELSSATSASGGVDSVLDETPFLLDAAPALARLLQPTALYTSAIQELDLSENRIGPESCRLLCAALQQTATPLRKLSLTGNPLRVSGGHAVAELLTREAASYCKLEELHLGNTALEVENLIAISSALRENWTLRVLSLDKPVIRTKEEEAIQHIGKMLQVNETLQVLSLNKHQLSDHGAQVLAERLLDNHTLQRLTLRANNIGATGAEALAGLLLRHDTLAEFDLSANRIGDKGAQAFAKLLRHNTRPLSVLALCSTYLTDDGLAAIAQACLSPRHEETNRLQSLLLWGNDWGKESSELFLELHRGRFADWEVETDFLPIPSDDGGIHIAHKEVVRAVALESPRR